MEDRDSASPPTRSQGKQRQHRACDYCRTHRIKCVPVKGDERCRRCLDHGHVCDKFSAPPKDVRPRRRTLYKGGGSMSQLQGVEPGYLGSSSLSFLAWRYAPQKPEVIDRFRRIDDRHDLYRGSIGGLEQDGLLVGQSSTDLPKAVRPSLMSVSMAKAKLLQELGAESVLTALYETCRDRIAPVFPVVSVSESVLADKTSEDHVSKYAPIDPGSTPPTPLPHIVRMIHCAIASRSREVPTYIQQSILSALHNLLNGPEMEKISTTPCLSSIQVLVLMSMCDDLNGADAPAAVEAVWQNVGNAIRMGFGIGLHRYVSASHIPYFQMNRRLRVWGACIAMDRWLAIRLGRVCAINLDDCDAPLPRHYADGVREGENHVPGSKDPGFPCFRFLAEFASLSILMGRAYRLVGTPSGLQSADELSFVMLQLDIDSWIAQLPSQWPYSIRLVLHQAPALMDLFIVALEFTLQRAFLWPTTPIPSHITYRPTRERWLALCQRAEQAVFWLNTPDGAFYMDVWSTVVYPAFCCVIIHLKALEEAQTVHKQVLLGMADNVIQQWAAQMPTNPVRSRLAAMSTHLRCAATESAAQPFAAQDFSSTSLTLNSDYQLPLTSPSNTDPLGLDLGSDVNGLDAMWLELV